MINARKEFEALIEEAYGIYKATVVCASIRLERDCPSTQSLKIGFTPKDYDLFLKSIDFCYSLSPYKMASLSGLVFFTEGVWAERTGCRESETWALFQKPEIPDSLKQLEAIAV